MSNLNVATLKLFNAIQVQNKKKSYFNKSAFTRAFKSGFVLDQFIEPDPLLLTLIERTLGLGGEKLNASFHKSWGKVASASDLQLYVEQILHYITTYGFESLGIYDERNVYIPAEILDVPDTTQALTLTFIRALTPSEMLDKIVELASSGIALSKDTLENIMVIVQTNRYNNEFVSQVKNRELYTLLCDFYNIVPTEPVSYLRYLVTKLTNESLLIKNKKLVSMIKQADGKTLDKYLPYAPDNLASIFLRFKPLFLAMKSISKNKTFFNRLRKNAIYQHVPMSEDYLNTVTGQLNNGDIKITEFKSNLKNYSIWRKIRLANALNNRLANSNSIVYKIRNGKGWVTESNWSAPVAKTQRVLKLTLESIADDIRENVEGVVFYIPSNTHYALPATEKQFMGNVPANSYVAVSENDVVVGVHWYNQGGRRIDIDLSLRDEVSKFGWDRSYRNNERSVMFSGDMTDAPLPSGASELFYLKNGTVTPKILAANYYNYDEDFPIDCQFIVANEKVNRNFEKNYVVNQNNIQFSQPLKLTEKETTIALVLTVGDETRIYFSPTSSSNSITSRNDTVTAQALEFYRDTFTNTLGLKQVLEMAGAIVVDDVSDIEDDYVDLSLTAIDKTTIINLLTVS